MSKLVDRGGAFRVLCNEILQYIFEYSIKYTPSGGDATLTAQRQGSMMQIAVCDTGFGIPTQEKKKIFTKFFRATNAKKKDPNGSGRGLYLVQLLVKLLDGTVEFVSKEHEGSTFTINLPIFPLHYGQEHKESSRN